MGTYINELKDIKVLPLNTTIRGYYSIEGEPSRSMDLVAIDFKGNKIFVHTEDMLRKFTPNDLLESFNNGIQILR
jgi:hypothetical protein